MALARDFKRIVVERVNRDPAFVRRTQEQCAEKAEMATAYLSGVERGVRNPTVKVLAQLADPFGVFEDARR